MPRISAASSIVRQRATTAEMWARSSSSTDTSPPTARTGPRPALSAIRSGNACGSMIGRRPEDHRPLDGVAQLADVARPRVARERALGRGREADGSVRPTARAKNARKRCASGMMSSRRSRSVGTRHLDDVEAEEEVLAEAAGLHVVFEVAVRRRDDAHVGLARARLAQPLELTFLQEAQQLGLQAGGQLADLVEEQRAALGGLDPPRLIADRAGERARRGRTARSPAAPRSASGS